MSAPNNRIIHREEEPLALAQANLGDSIRLTPSQLARVITAEADDDLKYKNTIMHGFHVGGTMKYTYAAASLRDNFPNKSASQLYRSATAAGKGRSMATTQSNALHHVRRGYGDGKRNEAQAMASLNDGMAGLTISSDAASTTSFMSLETTFDDMSVGTDFKSSAGLGGRSNLKTTGLGGASNLKTISEDKEGPTGQSKIDFRSFGEIYADARQDVHLTDDQKEILYQLMETGMRSVKADVGQLIKQFISDLKGSTETIKNALSDDERADAIKQKKILIDNVFPYFYLQGGD
jgi:hypothetical protein